MLLWPKFQHRFLKKIFLWCSDAYSKRPKSIFNWFSVNCDIPLPGNVLILSHESASLNTPYFELSARIGYKPTIAHGPQQSNLKKKKNYLHTSIHSWRMLWIISNIGNFLVCMAVPHSYQNISVSHDFQEHFMSSGAKVPEGNTLWQVFTWWSFLVGFLFLFKKKFFLLITSLAKGPNHLQSLVAGFKNDTSGF